MVTKVLSDYFGAFIRYILCFIIGKRQNFRHFLSFKQNDIYKQNETLCANRIVVLMFFCVLFLTFKFIIKWF